MSTERNNLKAEFIADYVKRREHMHMEMSLSSLFDKWIAPRLKLHEYSEFLEKNGYMDSDWREEKPNAIDRFMHEKSSPPIKREQSNGK